MSGLFKSEGLPIDQQTCDKIIKVAEKNGMEPCTAIFIGVTLLETMCDRDPAFLEKIKPEIAVIEAVRKMRIRQAQQQQGGMQPGQ